MKLVFLRDAEADLLELRAYFIYQFSVSIWRAYSRKLKEAILKLTQFPQLGSVPEEIAHLGMSRYRQIISGQIRVIYEIQADTITIHILCDTRRNLRTLLNQRVLRA